MFFIAESYRHFVVFVCIMRSPRGTTTTNHHNTMSRTINQIEKDIKNLRSQYDAWNKIQNEGATDGYNPYAEKFEALADEHYQAKKDSELAEWTLEVTRKRRAWFNSQGFTRPNEALAACRAQGWEWDALKEAIKRHS